MARSKTLDEFTRPTGTVIGKSVTLHHTKLTCADSESIRVDGTIIGDIEIEGILNVSDTGHISGSITAGYTRIAGRVVGNISCRNALHLASSANVVGDIKAGALIIDEGAVFMGNCNTHIVERPVQLQAV